MADSLLQIVRRLAGNETPDVKAKKRRIANSNGAADTRAEDMGISLLRSGTGGASLQPRQPQPAAPKPPLAAVQPPQSFYGNARQTAVDLAVQRFLAGVRHRLQPAAPYETFSRQATAFEFADAHAGEHDMRIFSMEFGSKGARHFIATDYATFWARYRRMLPGQRHGYEIIREGWPCHMYFDLEYPVQHNPDMDGDALVDRLRANVMAALQQQFGIAAQAAMFLELDSTSESKFSRHMIVRLPDVAFGSSRDVGAFVSDLLAAHDSGQYLVAKDAEGGRTCFIDNSVYSRNRAFRLYLSSKAGKTAVLQLSGRREAAAGASSPERETFLHSLVCNVAPDARLLRCSEEPADVPPSWRSTLQQDRGGRRQPTGSSSHASRLPSPFSEIDAFLPTVCNQGGSCGWVRSWMAMDSHVLLYGIGGNRYCGNIGRSHKSNGIYIVVDLSVGLWWQRCWDPDCRNYRSEAMPLPSPLLQEAKQRTLKQQQTRQHRLSSEGVLAEEATAADDDCDEDLLAATQELEEDALMLRGLRQWEAQQHIAPGSMADAVVAGSQ